MRKSVTGIAVLTVAGMALVGCADNNPEPAATVTETKAVTTSPKPSTSASTGSSASPTNLKVTPIMRHNTFKTLVEYTGVPAERFYDLQTDQLHAARAADGSTTWMGAKLIPGPYGDAEAKTMGENAYFLVKFAGQGTKPQVFPAGTSQAKPDLCSAAGLPKDIQQLWGWTGGQCPPVVTTKPDVPRPADAEISPELRQQLIQQIAKRVDLQPNQIARLDPDKTRAARLGDQIWIVTTAQPAEGDNDAMRKLHVAAHRQFVVSAINGKIEVHPTGMVEGPNASGTDRCATVGVPWPVRVHWGWTGDTCPGL